MNSRRISTLALATLGTAMTGANAFAVSLRVRIACANDYFAHCSQYSPESPQVRSCMRAVGNGSSKGCVGALVASGEVSAAEVEYRSGAAKTAAK